MIEFYGNVLVLNVSLEKKIIDLRVQGKRNHLFSCCQTKYATKKVSEIRFGGSHRYHC